MSLWGGELGIEAFVRPNELPVVLLSLTATAVLKQLTGRGMHPCDQKENKCPYYSE